MKRLIVLSLLVFIGVLGWRVGSSLSADSIGIVVGVVFGVLASIPAALLMLAAGRRSEREQTGPGDAPHGRGGQTPRGQGQYGGYPPLVIMAPPAMPMPQGQAGPYAGYPGGQNGSYLPQPNTMALPGSGGGQTPAPRQFRVVGEEEEWVEEW